MLNPLPRAIDVTRDLNSTGASLSQAHGSLSRSSQVMEGKAAAPAATRSSWLPEPGRTLRSYLRAAHAYMLISMPTGTSTIFGVFQVIWVSQVMVQYSHRCERKTAARLTQGFVRRASQIGLPQQTEQRLPCRRTQFPRIECSVSVPVGCIETLFDHGQIFIQRQRAVMVG